ncbi:AhpC/TSA family protein [Pseudooceanicola batsensis HTCC2597]|uniref:Glutathione-dependent peroxiredoxin n=1 Tax=Pseudooceanicola batsensis (strain ATCC BAA-863 / DSM 15984 / KCTC 12145 / HTCC2597) TaxID=252305 RepID=A3TVS1_PSEBH|nr:peroxiredoxin [Pseudooceanicola batsensis]EAQ03717.1 AhpC/TSA family protein [Pseudooceanicola batsensis HTCC2597]
MAISKGDTLPDATLVEFTAEGPKEVSLSERLAGRNVVIFALPGAYTGTCTTAHVPSFIRTVDQFRDKGVDEVICLSVNDPFVMAAWGKDTGAADAGIAMLGDPRAEFTKAVGMDFTAPPVGLIDRSKRYAMYVKDGVVTVLHAEENPGQCDVSGGESMLEAI